MPDDQPAASSERVGTMPFAILPSVHSKLPMLQSRDVPAPEQIWLSKRPYDSSAELIWIDDVYPTFIRYELGSIGNASGNVITLSQDCAPGGCGRSEGCKQVAEHERQHVIQFYEIPEFDAQYEANPLYYEKQADARALLSIRERPSDIFITCVCNNLWGRGMDPGEALHWIEDVLRTRQYEGVQSPYPIKPDAVEG